jgi:hypothetical protein
MQGRGVKHARRRHAEDERFIPGGERFVIETMPARWRALNRPFLGMREESGKILPEGVFTADSQGRVQRNEFRAKHLSR